MPRTPLDMPHHTTAAYRLPQQHWQEALRKLAQARVQTDRAVLYEGSLGTRQEPRQLPAVCLEVTPLEPRGVDSEAEKKIDVRNQGVSAHILLVRVASVVVVMVSVEVIGLDDVNGVS